MTFEENLNNDRITAALSLSKDPEFSLENFSNSDKVKILAMTSSALASQNDIVRAEVYLDLAHDIAKKKLSKSDSANRSLAAAAINLAHALEKKAALSNEEINLMIRSAFIGKKCWEVAGISKEVGRAEYRLAKVFLRADVLDRAFEHAEKCLSIISENDNDPLEVFFGFEALALIERARKNELGFIEAREKMQEAFRDISPNHRPRCKEILDKMAALPAIVRV